MNRCHCNPGYAGDGVKVCKERCVCRVRGDPIVECYDPQWLLLMGHKKYTLSKHLDPTDDCSFNIEIKAGLLKPNEEGLTYPRYLDVEIYNLKLRFMQHGQVYYGEDQLTLPAFSLDPRMNITMRGHKVILATQCGIDVSFDGIGLESVATVVVPPRFSGHMTGLCGDCDGIADDIKTRQHVDMEHKSNKYTLISNSFQVDETND